MNIFLGDEVTICKADCWITGKVNGMKLDKGHLEMIAIDQLDMWFRMDAGWRFINDTDDEITDVD